METAGILRAVEQESFCGPEQNISFPDKIRDVRKIWPRGATYKRWGNVWRRLEPSVFRNGLFYIPPSPPPRILMTKDKLAKLQ